MQLYQEKSGIDYSGGVTNIQIYFEGLCVCTYATWKKERSIKYRPYYDTSRKLNKVERYPQRKRTARQRKARRKSPEQFTKSEPRREDRLQTQISPSPTL